MKSLVIIQDVLEARSFARQYRNSDEWQKREIILFSPDPESFRFFASFPDLEPIQESAYDDTSSQGNVSSTAYDLASAWTRYTGKSDSFMYRNISLPLIVQREMTYFWVGLLRNIHILNELCRQTKPDEIWISQYSRPDLFFYAPSNYTHYTHIVRANVNNKAKIREFKLCLADRIVAGCMILMRKALFLLGGYWTRQELKRTSHFRDYQFTAILKDILSLFSNAAFRIYYFLRPAPKDEAILVSSSLSHIKPVVAALKADYSYRIDYIREVFGPRQALRMLKERIYFKSLKANLGRMDNNALKQFSEVPAQSSTREEFEGVDLIQAARFKLNFLIRSCLPQIAKLIDSAYLFLDTENYKGVIGEEDICVFNKVLFETAKQKGIRSIVVQHGATGLPVAFTPLSATYFAAWGEFSKECLVRWGVPNNRIIVTGNPAYDRLVGDSLKSRTADLADRYGINKDRPVLLVAMFPFRDYSSTDFPEVSFSRESYVESLKEIIKGLKPFQDYRIILKLHPRDSGLKKCEQILQGSASGNITLVQEGNIAEWAPLCRAAVSFFSSSVIDLIASKTPLVMLDITGDAARTRSIFPVEVPIIPVRAYEISEALKHLLSDESSMLDENTVNHHIYKLDGKASARVAALLSDEGKREYSGESESNVANIEIAPGKES